MSQSPHSITSHPLSSVVQAVQVRCYTPSSPGLAHHLSSATTPQVNSLSPGLPVFSLTPYGGGLSPQGKPHESWSPQHGPTMLKETMPWGLDGDLMEGSHPLKGSIAFASPSPFSSTKEAQISLKQELPEGCCLSAQTPALKGLDCSISPDNRALSASPYQFLSSMHSVQFPRPATPSRFQAPAPPKITLREATPEDAEGIIALRDSLDMTGAVSLLWDLPEMRQRIATRCPLLLVAVSPDPREDSPTKGADMVVGVSGIDVYGMEKELHLKAIGSRILGAPANADYTFPSEYCMCRGLLIHPLFQGAGLGSKLHKGRLKLLASLAPDTKGVILGARGSTLEEALTVIAPHLEQPSDVTPVFTKDELFEFTFHTSQGVVHMVHGKDHEGWKFVGVDIADGGAIWITSQPLPLLVSRYEVEVEGLSGYDASISPHDKGLSIVAARRGTAMFGG